MERRRFIRTTGTVATAGLIGIAGCGGAPSDQGDDGSTPDGNTVLMVTEGSEFFFDPIGLFVESGETVTFEIDSGSHSSTAYEAGNGPASATRIPSGAEAWDSGTLTEAGATFEHTFETTGTYDYFCIPHKSVGMVGRIVVGEPGGPADGTMPPDGDVPQSQTIVDQGSVSHSDFTG